MHANKYSDEIKETAKPFIDNPVATAVNRDFAISRLDIVLASSAALLVAAITLIWFSFDYHMTLQDEARHILNAMAARDLLVHFRPWQYHWWYQCLAVDPFYPPLTYFVSGAFLLVFGESRFIEELSRAFFAAIMVVSVYSLARLLHATRRAACIASICIAMYPAVSSLSHTFYLELPEVSMTAFALAILLWWRSYPSPKIVRSILSGLAIGIACLTKQLVAAYVLPVGLYFLFLDLRGVLRNREAGGAYSSLIQLGQTICLGIVTAVVGLPFLIVSYQANRCYSVGNLEAFASKGVHPSFIDNLNQYLHLLPAMMTPILLGAFAISVFFLRRREYLNFLPVIISAIGGLFLCCAFPGMGNDYRYLIPFLICTAVISGLFLDKVLSSTKRWWQATAIVGIFLALSNYFVYNFAPYPLPLPHLPWQCWRVEHNGNPTPYADWGHALVLETIKKTDGNKFVYLNLLSNCGGLHVHAFELYLKEHGNITIIPTGSRGYTIVGDQVEFSPKTALYHHWYLWKTGYVGYPLYNKESEANYERLVNFVRNSGNYKLMAKKDLPDGSELMLYRRKF